MITDFEKISIRGRLAFCAKVLENAFKKEHINREQGKLVLKKIWEFTNCTDLGRWEMMIKEITPSVLFDSREDFRGFRFFTLIKTKKMKGFYELLPEYLTDIIEYTIAVGTENVYGGTGEYSLYTLEALRKVCEIGIQNKIPIPQYYIFKKYLFSDNHGWGVRFSRKDISRIPTRAMTTYFNMNNDSFKMK